MQFDINAIKVLREETGAGVLEVKEALEASGGDTVKAREELMKKVSSKAAKKADRNAGDGLVYSYIHSTGKVGSLIEIACETDFVARTEDFKKLCREVAMQVCTSDFQNVEELNASEYIRDAGKTIKDIVNEVTAKTGEKIEIKRFVKFTVGE
jgi:elongation factor Ts